MVEETRTKLGKEQRWAYNLLETTFDNYFVTGRAGTGKSVLLKYFVEHTAKQTAVLAPTGVAALNVGGQTIHSFFTLKQEIQDPLNEREVRRLGRGKKTLLRGLQTLVIDEISMVSADIMQMIDAKLKKARGNDFPFGGVQVIVFGDLYQLPPVVRGAEATKYLRDNYQTVYFFGADEVQKHPFTVIELTHGYRQRDAQFLELLNKIRLGQVTTEVEQAFRKCYEMKPRDEHFITLTGDNYTARQINQARLSALPGKEYVYQGNLSGKLAASNMPTDLDLRLKEGAQVMMLKNEYIDQDGQNDPRRALWMNGTLGTIAKLRKHAIKVRIGEQEHWVAPAEWKDYRYTYDSETKTLGQEEVAKFSQYPIKLAYAVTIHKSQGQTYDAVRVDLARGAFAAGQVYVALSRCRKMEQLYLARPLMRWDVRVDPEVEAYLAQQEKMVWREEQ